jgi:cell wall-associated NlpC family hydrolase
MKYGICMQAATPVYETPSWKNPMINQLLFGDLFMVKAQKDNWLLVEAAHDNSEGWIFQTEATATDESFYAKALNAHNYFFHALSGWIKNGNSFIPVTRGALFHFWDEGTFKINNKEFFYFKSVHPVPEKARSSSVIEIAKSYLESPFLPGGMTPFGIDSCGLVQMAFRMNGINLPRKAAKQMEHGEQIMFVEAARAGDLAFFENHEGDITHTGIITGDNKIIHSFGKVRIDNIDHQGIFNEDLGKYTHKLRVVKRVLI